MQRRLISTSLLVLLVTFALAMVARAHQEKTIQNQKSTITIVKANYGQNCKLNVEQGDYTALMKQACDGKENCSYGGIGEKGDMCPNFLKDFDWSWTCSGHPGHRSGHIDGEASKETADAYCPFMDEISKIPAQVKEKAPR
jgi:hypothetical protein